MDISSLTDLNQPAITFFTSNHYNTFNYDTGRLFGASLFSLYSIVSCIDYWLQYDTRFSCLSSLFSPLFHPLFLNSAIIQ